MGKKGYWLIIIFTLAVNVVMLQWTIEAYYGREFDHVFRNTAIAFASCLICFIAYLKWRKAEYRRN